MSEAVIDPPAAAPGFLSGAPETPPATPPQESSAAHFLSEAYHKNGEFNEGWSKKLEEAGYGRLAAKGALAKDERTFLKSLDDTLQFVGKKAGHLPPNEKSTPEEVAAYRKQVGAPEDPKEYGFKPAKMPEGMPWDEARAAKAEAILHKHNASTGLAKELADYYGEVLTETQQQAQEAFEANILTDIATTEKALREEWGPEYDTRLTQNKNYAKAVLGEEALSDPIIRAALSKAPIVRLLDQNRREVRGKLPGASSEMAGASTSPQQEAEALMAKHPNWQNEPAIHERINTLFRMQAAQDGKS
jgi:hypothetical protein